MANNGMQAMGKKPPVPEPNVNETGLRTALRRYDLVAELLHLAVLRLSVSNPKQKYTTDGYQRGLMPVRIRTRDQWSHRRNSLRRQRTWRILHEQ